MMDEFWRSEASWRVRMILDLKVINYEWARLNISRLVKIVKSGKLYLLNSLSFAEYLDNINVDFRERNKKLLPDDSPERDEVLRLCEVINN